MELTNPQVIREIQRKFGFEFKKGFGQNFLTSQSVLSEISNAAQGTSGVLEIGPGFGVLTKELADCFEKVVAIEVDKRLPDVLKYTLSDKSNVKVINGDCLKINLKELTETEFGDDKFTVAANLPYYITTPIIAMLLESKLNIEKIVIMVQKEVAERLCASPGTKAYGAISVFCDFYAESEIVTTVSKNCFVPSPKVDSAVVKMTLRYHNLDLTDEKTFFRVVKAAFSQRRKTILNCLSSSFDIPKAVLSNILTDVGIGPIRRGETMSKQEFAMLSNKIYEKTK